MHLYYIVSGTLLILPTIDFAVAAPVLVQEQPQAPVSVKHILEDSITKLGKRGGDWNMLFTLSEDHFAKPEESLAAGPSSNSPSSGPYHEWAVVEKPPPSVPEKPSTMSDADYEFVGAHAQPNPVSSMESGHKGLMGVHASQPNLGPSNPGPSTEFNSDHRLAVVEPPSRPALPTEFDVNQEYHVGHPPPLPPLPGSASPTKYDPFHWKAYEDMPDRRSMGVGSQLENRQAVSNALKGKAKESHRNSGPGARDVLNAAQRELQPERSHDPAE